jgi:16S rRNA (cytidine1402-2'-O)-methyltransferase
MIPRVIHWLETGTDVVLVSDAGMPSISDPGWRVVDAVWEAGYPVEVIPGPSALDTAIVASGMDASRVWFGGFLPKKEKHQQEIIEEVRRLLDSGVITMAVIYESPKRLKETIGLFDGLWVAACGELTKMHEKVIRGSVQEVLAQLPLEIKGEWVVLVGKN